MAGLIPLLIFWVEHRVVQKLRAENPDLAPVAHSGGVTTAFVLGGGGVLGAVEVGMLRALFEREVRPDLVLGTSIGAFNGALVASQPDLAVVERLTELWQSMSSAREAGYGDRTLRTVRRAVASGTHLWSAEPLRQRLVEQLGDLTFEELPVTFQVCAASIERSAEHWFTSGRVVDAVVASAAVPGLLPPAVVDGEHYLDGGIVNSIPLGRAVELGATRVFVLQVGRLDRPLTPPRRPWEVARVSFEIARRHRFVRELAELPDSVECHVLPARGTSARDDTLLGSRDFSGVQARIDATYDASRAYLDEHASTPPSSSSPPLRSSDEQLAGTPEKRHEAAVQARAHRVGRPRSDPAALGPASHLAGRRSGAVTTAPRPLAGAAAALDRRPLRDDRLARCSW